MAPNPSAATIPDVLTQHSWEHLAHAFEGEVCDIVAADRRNVIGRTIMGLSRDCSRSTLLDLGCGIGTFIRTYGHRFQSVYGADFSSNMLRYAKRRCNGAANVRWLQADLNRIDHATMPTGDVTVCLNVVTAPRKRIREKMLKSLWTLTNPGGTVLLVVPSLESTRFVHRTIKDGRLTEPTKRTLRARGLLMCDGVTQKYFSKQEILDSVRKAGFRRCTARRVWIPWSEEGLEDDHPGLNGKRLPWDWLVVGHRTEGGPGLRLNAAPHGLRSAPQGLSQGIPQSISQGTPQRLTAEPSSRSPRQRADPSETCASRDRRPAAVLGTASTGCP